MTRGGGASCARTSTASSTRPSRQPTSCAFFNRETGKDLTPIFDQYLRHAAIPVLELRFPEAGGSVSYRWKADARGFAMPVKVGAKDDWQTIRPTTEWQTMPTALTKDQFEVATDLYFITVDKQ